MYLGFFGLVGSLNASETLQLLFFDGIRVVTCLAHAYECF